MGETPRTAKKAGKQAAPGARRKETPRALAMKARYLAMPLPRSLHRLAEDVHAEQAKAEQEAREARRTVPPVSSVEVIERQLQEWSRLWGWTDAAAQADMDAASREQRRREEALQRMNDERADVARAEWVKLAKRLSDQVAEDEAAIATWKKEVLKARSEGSEPPKRPRASVSPFTLVQALKVWLDEERLARGAATEIVQNLAASGSDAGLPRVVEVVLAATPPVLPADMAEDDTEEEDEA